MHSLCKFSEHSRSAVCGEEPGSCRFFLWCSSPQMMFFLMFSTTKRRVPSHIGTHVSDNSCSLSLGWSAACSRTSYILNYVMTTNNCFFEALYCWLKGCRVFLLGSFRKWAITCGSTLQKECKKNVWRCICVCLCVCVCVTYVSDNSCRFVFLLVCCV